MIMALSPFFLLPPLPYYLMIRGVIAQLKRIPKLGLITFFSTRLFFVVFSPPFFSLFPPLRSTPLHIRCSALFRKVNASVSTIRQASQFSKPRRCRELWASLHMHKLKAQMMNPNTVPSHRFADICMDMQLPVNTIQTQISIGFSSKRPSMCCFYSAAKRGFHPPTPQSHTLCLPQKDIIELSVLLLWRLITKP